MDRDTVGRREEGAAYVGGTEDRMRVNRFRLAGGG
ncbi:hypothetical protein B2K_40420 [Paenibacillus mucilaginosus K02]|uniref:Uncharacterized protein n=1 Tax=Paenibacillus mucilaginosus K02 TaxID=997761 RepID=R9UNJ3_9BACL|nr:hypothetical protein B2K_40420 [Paenibacillus mucilaginosus K02]